MADFTRVQPFREPKIKVENITDLLYCIKAENWTNETIGSNFQGHFIPQIAFEHSTPPDKVVGLESDSFANEHGIPIRNDTNFRTGKNLQEAHTMLLSDAKYK